MPPLEQETRDYILSRITLFASPLWIKVDPEKQTAFIDSIIEHIESSCEIFVDESDNHAE